MKTYFMNLKKLDFSTQSISDASTPLPDCFEVSFELEETITSYEIDGAPQSMNQPDYSQAVQDSPAFRTEILRSRRDQLLGETMWINERHLSQAVGAKTLTDTQYAEWQTYWQLLRDIPGDSVAITAAVDLLDLSTLVPITPTII